MHTEAQFCLVTSDGDLFPTRAAGLMHSIPLKDTLPMLPTATENSGLPAWSCPTPLCLSHSTSSLTLFPLTLLDDLTLKHPVRVLPAHSGAGSALPLLPELEDQGLQRC